MEQKDWAGIFPAITTPFRADLSVDHQAFATHAQTLIKCGCHGIVALGSLGEAPTLTREEKVQVLANLRRALGPGVPLVAGISSLSTAEAVWLAKEAERAGADGLMLLPPQLYRSDWHETETHLNALFAATSLSCMLYNNPVAYGTDILPEQMVKLRARHQNFHAVKESSGDLRRVTSLRFLAGGSLAIFVGMDDVIVESVAAGANGWIAGLVNAFPEESVRLFRLAQAQPSKELDALYSWFLPLLRLDTVPKFVQLIKLAQQECGGPAARVRPPRLELTGNERNEVVALVQQSLASLRSAQ